eukprot:4983269-Alexandrium_andersonii.AAC.1
MIRATVALAEAAVALAEVAVALAATMVMIRATAVAPAIEQALRRAETFLAPVTRARALAERGNSRAAAVAFLAAWP